MAISLDEKKQRLAQRQARIDADAARLAKTEKKTRDRRCIIVGATILNAMAEDAELAHLVVLHLKNAVTRENDQKHILDLIGGTVASQSATAGEIGGN